MSHLLHELQGGDDSYDDDDDSYYDDDHDQDTETPVKTLDEYIQGQVLSPFPLRAILISPPQLHLDSHRILFFFFFFFRSNFAELGQSRSNSGMTVSLNTNLID